MRSYNNTSQFNQSQPRGNSSHHNNRYNNNRTNSNNNSINGNQRNFETRKIPGQQENQLNRQQQYQLNERHCSQQNRDHSTNRDRIGQYPDSSFNKDHGSNLGSVRFTPGHPTRELPPIETKPDPTKKFTGRCRLFVGNLPHNTSEEQLRKLFEPFGEIGELFIGPKSSFAFVKMDTKQNAEAARDALDCGNYDGRSLRVRLAAHAAAIKVKNLSPVVTNELLAYAFRYFGEIERAVVIVDDKGRSTGEGIIEYSRKQSALYAIKRCQQECFMLTQAPIPVLVEPYDQLDDEEGLPERSINKNTEIYKDQRDVGPRFAEQGSFEHMFALKWKELYLMEKQKRENLERDFLDARKNLQNCLDMERLEHKAMSLQNQLQQLEDNRIKLQQIKEQTYGCAQEREEGRIKQETILRQREDVLLRQQMSSSNFMSQSNSMQGLISSSNATDNQNDQQNYTDNSFLQETDQSSLPVNPMLGCQGLGIQGQLTSFSEAAMIGMNYMNQPPMGGYIIPSLVQGTTQDHNVSTQDYNQGAFTTYPVSNDPQNQKSTVNTQARISSTASNNGRGRKRARL